MTKLWRTSEAVRRGLVVAVALFLLVGGCAYFNLFYNAQQSFDDGERLGEEVDPRDQPTSQQRNQYNRAIRKCQLLLEEYPDSGHVDDALFLMGKSHYRMREWTEAVRNFENLLVNFPASEFAEEATYLLSISYLSRGDEEEGLQWFARLREGYPDGEFAGEALYRLGDAWANAGRSERAIESYREFLENYPDRAEAARTRIALARILLDERDPEGALVALEGFTAERVQSSRERATLEYDAATLRVQSLLRAGRAEEALQAVDMVDETASTDADGRKAVLLRGRALLATGRVEEGRQVLADLVASQSLQPEATTARRIAIEYFSRNEGPESETLREEIQSVRDAGRMAGNDVRVVQNHVNLLESYDNLKANYDAGDSTSAAAAFRLGEMVYTRYRRPREARDWYVTSVEMDPNGPYAVRAMYAIGWLSFEELEEPEMGEQWFAQIEECCPDSPQARSLRGEVFAEAKPRTREELERIAGMAPAGSDTGPGAVDLSDPRLVPWRTLRRGGPGALTPREVGP